MHKIKSELMPILVSGPGRSGTTLLMGLLANAPGIVAAELAPYETRLISYYGYAHNILTHLADVVRSTSPDALAGDQFHIGFNPYYSQRYFAAFSRPSVAHNYAEHYVPEQISSTFRALITEYYLCLAQDKKKENVRYFAEKNDNLQVLIRAFTRRAFGSIREIITIRDPRDVLCSHLSYFKNDAERSFADITRATRIVLGIHAESPSDMYFNVYERLLHGEKECFTELSEFLQTEIVQPTEEARQKVFARHGTSTSADATVDRWRSDLSQEWQERCVQAWKPFLEAFGYSLK